MKEKKLLETIHHNYHWVVAGVMFIMVFFYGGVTNNLSSLHIVPVTEYLEISRAEFSMLTSSRMVTAMISTFISGFLISRYGARLCSGLGMAAGMVGYLLLAQMKTPFLLVPANALLGIGSGLCSTAAAVFVTRVWFHRHGGTVLGVITAASGVGSSLMCILQTAVMEFTSFRGSYVVCAVASGIGALLVFLFVRNKPQDMGLMPLGYGETIKGRRSTNKDVGVPGYTMKELWRRPAFYLIFLATALSSISVYMAFTVILPFVVDCGYTAAEASGIQSFMLLFLTAVKILTGYLNDHIGGRKVFLICLITGAVGMGILAWTENYYLILLAVFIYICCLPLTTLAVLFLATDLFGYRAQAEYTGILLSLIQITAFIGEVLTNAFYDHFGSYHFSFFIGVATAVATMLILWIMTRLEKKQIKE